MKQIVMTLLLLSVMVGCKKEKQDKDKIGETICVDGTIRWTGDPAVDGTGWVLIADTEAGDPKRFILKDLSTVLQVDGLAVNACVYEIDEEVGCFCAVQPNYYKIESIKKR